MSKITRYEGNLRAFGSDAQGMERTVFGETTQADDLTSQVTTSFLRGWGIVGASEHPSLEDFNAAMYAMSQFIAYQHQMGIPEWHAEQEYYLGSICTHNGESYQSLGDANVGNEPPSAAWTSILTARNGLANLGLGAGAPAIGIPFFWPSSAMPNTVMEEWVDMVFLKFNGATFSATAYPKLAKVIPSLKLTEARGEFPRIWDDGRGVDAGRSLLSTQSDAIQNITGSLGRLQMFRDVAYSGPFSITDSALTTGLTPSTSGGYGAANFNFDVSKSVRTAAETRSRNIAFNFLVRAK